MHYKIKLNLAIPASLLINKKDKPTFVNINFLTFSHTKPMLPNKREILARQHDTEESVCFTSNKPMQKHLQSRYELTCLTLIRPSLKLVANLGLQITTLLSDPSELQLHIQFVRATNFLVALFHATMCVEYKPCLVLADPKVFPFQMTALSIENTANLKSVGVQFQFLSLRRS